MTARGSHPFRVLITRSAEGNQELATKLRAVGLEPIAVDTISIAPLNDWSRVDRFLLRLAEFDWLVFTSATGVKYFGMRMNELSQRMPWGGRPKTAAVGLPTAKALLGLGIKADFIPSGYLTRLLAEELPAEPGARVLLLRADIADPRLSSSLLSRGFVVEEAAIYKTVVGKGGGVKVEGADAIVFASASAVRGLCARLSCDELYLLKPLPAVCIGPVTESAAKEEGFSVTTKPDSSTIDALVGAVERLRLGVA